MADTQRTKSELQARFPIGEKAAISAQDERDHIESSLYTKPEADTDNTIQPAAANVKPLIVKGAVSQTANLLEVLTSGDSVLVSVDASGNVVITGTLTGGLSGGDYITVNAGTVDLDATAKNQPDGWVGLDENGAVSAILIHRTGSASEINALVLEDGEIAVTTDSHEIRLGDGETAGGLTLSGSTSTAAISVFATGTTTENGTALAAAYTLAASLTPNGASLSATNRATVIVHSGVYALQAQLSLANYVDILGVGQPTIETKSTNNASIRLSSKNVALKSLRLTSSTSTYMLSMDMGAGLDAKCEDLFFDCLGSPFAVTTIPTGSGNINGTFRRCRTDGTSLFGTVGQSGFGVTAATLFEDCEGGSHSFGGAEFGGITDHLATIRRCRMFGDTWNVRFGGTMENCDWSCGIVGGFAGFEPLINDARFYYCRFAPSSGYVFENQGASINIKVAHCVMPSGAFDSNITNDIGTPYNVEDDDI